MAEKKVEPKRPTGDEKAAGARKAEKKSLRKQKKSFRKQKKSFKPQRCSASKRARGPGRRPGPRRSPG